MSIVEAPANATVDAFLGGMVEAVQPATGHHRSGLEAVLLGAALDADATGAVVDLGAGAGVAGFCAAARCPGIEIILAERDATLVACAAAALQRPANGAFADRVRIAEVDIAASEAERAAAGLARATASVVITNPPFHDAATVRRSPSAARAGAHVLATDLDLWFRVAAHTLEPGGTMVAVTLASALPELLAALAGRFGGARLLPLHPRPGASAERMLVRAVKGSRASPAVLPGLTVHGPEGSAYTEPLTAILRHGAGLGEIHSPWRDRPSAGNS